MQQNSERVVKISFNIVSPVVAVKAFNKAIITSCKKQQPTSFTSKRELVSQNKHKIYHRTSYFAHLVYVAQTRVHCRL